MQKKFLSILMVLAMVMSLMPQGIITVSAMSGGGSGTATDPYIITTADELSTIGGKENKNTYFRLGNNITVDSSFSTIEAFYGVLDGNGKTITGVNITEKINSNGSVTSTGRLFNTIEANAIVYNLTLDAPKLKVDYTDVASTTNSYALNRGLFVNTNKGTLNNISLVSVNVDADVEGYNEVTQSSNLTVRELGVMVSRNSGEILNSNISGTVTARNINLFGTVAYQNLPTGTVANVVSNVELKIVPINDNDMGYFHANSLGIAENRGYVYNLWALGTISGGNDRWYATNSSRYLCVYNSGTIENGYYKPSTGKFELSGAVNNSTPGLGTGTSSGIVEKTALDNSIYTSNQTAKASEIVGSGSGTLYTVEWRNDDGTILKRELCNAGNIKIPHTVDEDHYCDTWKDSSNTTRISGSTYTVSGNTVFTAQNVQGKYYIAFDGEKTILPSEVALPVNYPFVWKKIGSDAAESTPPGVTMKVEIAKVGSDGKASDFAGSYTGTISAGDKFCYRYTIVSTTNDRVKLGTYNMYTESSSGVVIAASYKVEKITLTADNYSDFISLTVPTGEVYLAEGGYNYPSATGKSGAAAVPTGIITISYMDSNGNDVTGEPTEVGEYSVFLSVAEDENFNEASGIDTGKTYKIDKATPTITANMQPTSVAYGDSITVTVDVKAKLKGDGTEEFISGGTVGFKFGINGVIDESKTQIKNVEGTSLEFTVTDLPDAGTLCTYSVSYSGSGNYNTASTYDDFIVGKAPSTTAVTLDKTSYTYGEDMVITVDAPQAADETELTVSDIYDASANISFVEKNSDGKYVYKYTKPNGGDRTVKAEYIGSTNYSSSSDTETATVEKLQLNVTVTPSASSYQYQDEVKIKLSVTGVPTGGSTSIRDFSIAVYSGDNIVSSMPVSNAVPFTDKEISLGKTLGAGTYDIYVALDDDNYTVPMGEIMKSVTVERRAPVVSDFSYRNDFSHNTYDKTEKTVTVEAMSAVAADMGTVTVEYRRNGEIVTAPVDAGWYNVYVCVDDSGPNIKAGTVEFVGYGINQKTPDASDMTVKINGEAPSAEYPYTGKTVTATVTSADEGAFDVTAVSYYKKDSEGNYVLISDEPADAGSYLVKVATAEGTNYSAATDVEVAAFEITKADPDITLTNSGAVYYYDSAITVAGSIMPKLSIYDTAKRPTGTLTAELIDTSDSSSKVLPADKVNFLEEYGTYDVTFEPKTDFSAGKTYRLKLTYSGDENYNTATLMSGRYEIAKSKVIFEVSEKEHQYSPGEERGIKVQPKIGGMTDLRDVQHMPEGGIVVKYYAVDENEGRLASTTPVQKAIAPGRYLYVISLSAEASESYECYDAEYTVTDTAIPDFAEYGNIGFMDIKSGNADAQKPIYFDNAVVNAHMTDTVTNPLNNPNASTVTYESKNTSVAEVNASTGEVTIRGAGSAVIVATSTKENASDVYASYTLTVKKAPITVSADDITLTYGDSFTATDITISGGVTAAELDGTLGFTTKYAVGKSVGEYEVTPYGLTSDTYDITFESGTITVNEKTLNAADFEITAANKVYDGTNTAEISAAVKADALVGADNLRAEVSGHFADENAGADKAISYEITSLSGKGFENYVLGSDVNTATVTASITPAKVTFFVSEETTKIYDGTVQKVDISAMALGNVFGESNYTVYYQADGEEKTTEPKNAGEYTVTVELTDESGNYEAIQPTAKLIIEVNAAASLAISGSNRNVTVDDAFTLRAYYGNQTPEVTWISSDENVAEVDGTTGEVTILKAGTATITATAKDANYGSAGFELEASKRRVNIKAPAGELVKTYNGERQGINFTSSDIDLEEKNVTVNVSYVLLTDPGVTEPKQVGTYTVSYEIDDERYTADGNVMLTINKANVVVKAKNISKEYGEEPEYEFEILSGENVTDTDEMTALAEFASEGEEKTAKAGTYDITVTLTSNGDENRNFIVSDEKGTLTVIKAPLTITVKNVSREYGAENPALEAEYEGFKNNETADVLTGELVLIYDESINAESAVDTYVGKTTASGLSSDNYEIQYVPGNVTVTKIGVTASAGTARSSYLTIKLDKAIAGLTANNFVVRSVDEIITLTEATASSDNKTYTLKGSFSTTVTYTVEIDLEGTENDATHEIISEALSIKPSSGSTGGGSGGSVAATTYTVTFETNGGNKIDSVEVSKNGTLSKPTEPTKEGFAFDGWYSDKELKTAYDFSAKVTKSFTLYAKWTEKATDPDKPTEPTEPTAPEWKNPFTDVKKSDWFYTNVEYAVNNKLMNGTTATTFAPSANLTRAMLVAILYRAEGEPTVNKSMTFADVDGNAYYASAVVWAQQNGIVNGVTENAFAPDDNITREQIAAIMFRFAKYKGYDVSVGKNTNILSYTDAESISEYAISAMQYAVGSGLMKGKTESTINPKDFATRAEIAAILQRFIEANK